MNTSRTRLTRAFTALAAAALAAGCSAVSDYGGAEVLLNVGTSTPSAAGEHLELWARDASANIIRLNPPVQKALVGNVETDLPAGYAIVQAVSFDDPCMIDDAGNLLWSDAAQTCGGTTRADCASDADRHQWATAVQARIHQITDLQPSPMLVFVGYDDNVDAKRPMLPMDAPPDMRLKACHDYWDASPMAYSGNPNELVTPVHGTFYGAVDYQSQRPATLVGGIQLKTDFTLDGIEELWLTRTKARVAAVDVDQVDCATHADTCRGSVLIDGPADTTGWRGVVHFVLASPCVGASCVAAHGAATVYVRLDEDPVQF